MASVGTVVIEIDANTAKLVEGIKKTEKSVNSLQKSLSKTKKDMADFAKAALGFYAVSKSIDLMTDALDSFVSTAAQFESFESTLKSITGSAKQAEQSMAWIGEFASTTPFNIDKVTSAFVKMKAYGLDPMNGTLKTLGDASAAMGKDIVQAVEAMADAVTGENERLKEFGIKAAKDGDKITYAWADSSGKSRDIVIENNKEIIESTLNAIFNEKYVGAMIEQSKTWNGMISNMEDQWTMFQRDVMSEGLFDYFKAMAMSISGIMGTAFDSAKNSAAGFSDYMIDGIKTIIRAVGDMADMWTGITAAYAAVKVAFFSLVVGIGEGVNRLGTGFEAFKVGIHNAFKTVFDTIGQGFHSMISFVLNGINTMITGVNSALGSYSPFTNMTVSVKEYKSEIDTAVMSSEKLVNLDWSNSSLNQSVSDLGTAMDGIINESGAQKAADMISKIDANVVKLTATEKVNNKAKEEANKWLIANGAAYTDLAKKATKATASAAKASKTLSKSLASSMKKTPALSAGLLSMFGNVTELGASIGTQLSDGIFDSMIQGDFAGSLESVFGNFRDVLIQPIEDSFNELFNDTVGSLLDGMVSSMTAAGAEMLAGSVASSTAMGVAAAPAAIAKGAAESGWPGLLLMTAAMAALGFVTGGMGGGGAATLSSAKAAAADNATPSSDSVTNILENIEDQGALGLKYSAAMVSSLKNMESLSIEAANGLTPFMTGAGYTDRSKKGFWNDSETKLLESGIRLDSASIQEINTGQMDAVSYMKESTENSGFWGIGSGVDIDTTTGGSVGGKVMQPITDAYIEGYNAMESAALAIGVSAAEFDTTSQAWESSAQQLNFAGLNAQEQAELIQGAIAVDMDTWAGTIASIQPLLAQYAQAGEGAGETLMRVAYEVETVSKVMRDMGRVLPPVAAGGIDVAEAMIKAAGGMEKFTKGWNTYTDGFYSEARKMQILGQDLAIGLKSVNLQLPATYQGFMALYEATVVQSATSAAAGEQVRFLNDNMKYFVEYYAPQMSNSINSLGQSAGTCGASLGGCGMAAGSCGIAAESASESLEILYTSLMDIAGLKAQWMDDIDGSRLILDTAIIETGLSQLNYDNFLSEFTRASVNGMTDEIFSDWQMMSDAIQGYHDVVSALEDEKYQKEMDILNEQVAFYEDILSRIDDAYLGSLSYFNTMQKAEYAGEQAAEAFGSGDTQSYIDHLGQQLEFERKMSVTKEDYAEKFDAYIEELQKTEPEATTDDVVDELESLNQKIDTLTDAIEKASFQGA